MGKKLTNCSEIAGFLLIVLSFYSLYSPEFSYGTPQIGKEDNTTLASGYVAEIVSENAAGATSLTVQPSVANTYIRDGASSGINFGEKFSIWLKKSIVGFQRRGILSFNFSALDDSAVIESAYLDLYYFNNSIGNDPVGETVEVNRLTQTGWVEGEATWDDYKNATPWTMAGGDYSATGQAAATMPGAFGWVRWPVTAQVKHAQRNTSEIAHMLVKFSSSAAHNAAARFLSKESGDPSKQPKLIIKYTTPAPAPVGKTGQTTSFETGDDGELQSGVAWPTPRFTDNGDGTIKDNLTNLIWDKDANRFGIRTWSQAITDCNSLAATDYVNLSDGSAAGDWHLANVNEIASLIHYDVFSPAVPDTLGTGQWRQGDPFNNVQLVRYWSSTSFAFDSAGVWVVGFNHGFVNNGVKGGSGNVWCVRGGQ